DAVPVCDCIELLGPIGSRVAHRVFRTAISLPTVYDGFHFAQLRAEGRLARGGDGASARRILRALERRGLVDGVALALAVFATGAPVAAALRRRNPGAKAVVFCTDATAHSRWVHESIDLYLATGELAAASLRRYEPQAEIAILPPPVRPEFYEAAATDAARARFGVPLDASCVLLVSGGWGLGPVAEAARALAADGHHVLAVSGSNLPLRRRLDELAREDCRIRSLGYCHDMPSAISAADVVVSAAGQTCNEVHAVGRRLVVLDSVPGHGRENLLNEVAVRGAAAASPSAESVVKGVTAALKASDPPPTWPVRSAGEWRSRFLRALEPLGVL
ncbi:MAG TPA: glycosyltransferase, partial [Acidimicrobiales bacterium]|nr:glycosyltransferase [Acidimicrobiales bacterium]